MTLHRVIYGGKTMENDIDFIKWMVEKAEDWEMMGKDKRWHLSYLLGDWIDNKSLVYTEVYYPLLLQRAIEGISIGSNSEWLIVQEWSLIRVRTYPKYTKEWKSFDYRAYQSLDQAKESALRYIWEQEQTQ